MYKYFLFYVLLLICTAQINAQNYTLTKQDTLRGSITPERIWWDLLHYDLHVTVNIEKKYFSGKNIIHFKVLQQNNVMQIDLQEPMQIQSFVFKGEELNYRKDGNAYFVDFKNNLPLHSTNQLEVNFIGNPKEAFRPPWDAAVTWSKDKNGKPFVATSCQGEGASMWWPCKDHMYDEAESMDMYITIPKGLQDVSNGRLIEVIKNKNNTRTYHWRVVNPINNYGVNINIGDYAHFSEKYKGLKGNLDCNYYVLKYNLKKAKKQFKQVSKMLEAFEYWFGPYPFYEDGFKLVETPYLGMEHQSSVTYGNRFENGYLGRDLSKSGWGLKFDFIIIHESGHEWFANSITNKDIADMWIHESFTAYSENLYLDYHFGTDASEEYVIGTRSLIQNRFPIIGPYHVNKTGSGTDMYYKGANMLHTLRQVVNNDEKWRAILTGLNKQFFHQTVHTSQIEDYISKESGIDLSSFFNQYLRDIRIPILEHYLHDGQLFFRWTNCVDGFNLKLKVEIDGMETWIAPTQSWNSKKGVKDNAQIKIDPNFYVASQRLTKK